MWLRGRRSVVLDLRDSEDHARFLELVRRSDVVLTSFGAGVREDLAIESSRLTTLNPVEEHTREILQESGFQAGHVDALVDDGVIHETLTL